MAVRVLLAVLILTNPICCQMFGSVVTVRTERAEADCDDCGCPCGDRDEPADTENVPHIPCECPNCQICQCVCAGAVVKDLVTVDDLDDGGPIDLVADDRRDAPCPELDHPGSFSIPMACGDANVGRSARLRLGSLLC